ncbi:MAG: SMI1/KNR4 family protein [Corynebacteriales bacterium]|nr:SMI1/KNR4 family protein [Mycobacteriales bacterium]
MSVTEAWDALMALLESEAPATARSFRPGATAEAVDAAERATGLNWPKELREFVTCQGGQREYAPDAAEPFGGQILPAQDMFGLDQILAERTMMIEVWQAIIDGDTDFHPGGYDGVVAAHPHAGSRAGAFLPHYIPISGMDGYLYFCDLRPGEAHGSVRAYYKDAADDDTYTWRSITDMVTGLREAIADGSAVDMWEPRIENGEVFWQPEGNGDEPARPTAQPGQLVIHTGYHAPPADALSRPFESPGADIDAIARAVRAAAEAKYGAVRVSGAQTNLRWIPQIPGFVADCRATVGGVVMSYAAVITDTPGEFMIVEIPPEGARFER